MPYPYTQILPVKPYFNDLYTFSHKNKPLDSRKYKHELEIQWDIVILVSVLITCYAWFVIHDFFLLFSFLYFPNVLHRCDSNQKETLTKITKCSNRNEEPVTVPVTKLVLNNFKLWDGVTHHFHIHTLVHFLPLAHYFYRSIYFFKFF